MSKKNEDGVEGFFRKAANQSDTSFMSADWRKMENMLDERFAAELAVKRQRIKRTVISGAALSAFLLSMYFVSFQTDQTLVGGENSAEQRQAAVVPKQDVHPEDPTAALLLKPEMINGEKDENTLAVAKEQSKKQGTQDVVDRVSKNHHERFADRSPTHDEMPESNVDDEKSVTQSRTRPTGSGVVVESSLANTNLGEEIAAEDNQADSTAAPVLDDALNDDGQQLPTDEKEISTTSRWRVNVLVAPDFSTTALSRYSAPGTSIGILIGFQLGKRFIVHSGASYNFKRYEGYGEEYQPPNGYWERRTNGIIPDEIQGRCQVLEIPLILQYNVRQSNRSRIFIGAGLGSYIMLDEKYDYAFNTPNPGAADGWSSESSTSYPWAVGSLSVGYDRQLSPAVSIGIEPFIKVPFGKIGWSNITLYTTGVNINMRYRFVKREPSIVSINQ